MFSSQDFDLTAVQIPLIPQIPLKNIQWYECQSSVTAALGIVDHIKLHYQHTA